eukprot:364557-Chlamydomonas_euryale.AAC.5
MLDYFAIFTRGGALLWTLQFTTLRHNPLEAINALVRDCLLEERSSDAAFTYAPKAGAAQTLKWTFHNVAHRYIEPFGEIYEKWGPPHPRGLNLVFVAVYQKSLSLMYVDELLSVVKDAFLSQYNSGDVDHSNFKQTFDKLLSDCEARADKIKRGDLLSKVNCCNAAAVHVNGYRHIWSCRPACAVQPFNQNLGLITFYAKHLKQQGQHDNAGS